MNKAFIIGNVGKDPEMKTTSNGGAIAKFSVATTFSYKDKGGERQEKTTWHNCVSFGKQAEVVGKYVFKGSKVAVEGRIENTTSTNDAGEKKYYSNIVTEQVEFLSKPKERSAEEERKADKKFDASDAFDDQDVPY